MKALIVLWLALMISLLASGCAGWTVMTEPQLGRYEYTRQGLRAVTPIRTIPIWIDRDFGEADKLAIDDAINAWNYAMNGYVKLVVVDTQFDMEIPKIVEQVKEGGWLFMKVTSDNSLVPSNDKGYKTIGFTEMVGGHHLYLVRDRLQNDDVFGVTLHEIGHLMGSEHVGDRLMYPHYSRARFRCIDYVTVQSVANAWDVPVERLNYCVDKDPGQVSDTPEKRKLKKDEMDKGPLL